MKLQEEDIFFNYQRPPFFLVILASNSSVISALFKTITTLSQVDIDERHKDSQYVNQLNYAQWDKESYEK